MIYLSVSLDQLYGQMYYIKSLLSIKPARVLFLQFFLFVIIPANAQEEESEKSLEIYGQLVTDIGYNFNQIDPGWFDIMRITKLPQHKDQFAPDGKIFFSVRQTKLGFKSKAPTPWGQLRTTFEFDLFGSGPNTGQTAFHFRMAYAELGRFTIGHTESVFTDTDVSPGLLDFGAPPSRAFLRTILVRYMEVKRQYRWAVALEKPGVTSDEGIYADRIELANVKAEFKLPDISAEYRRNFKSGYVELAGTMKWIKWKNTVPGPVDLSGSVIGWGINVSSVQHLSSKTQVKAQVVYGEGIQSHLTDAAFDIGIQNNFTNPAKPIVGVALPVTGGLIFLEHHWTDRLSSTIGYSGLRIYNSDAQTSDAFKTGSYAILNLLYRPFLQYLIGAELQWGKRQNFSDGFSSSAFKVQLSFRYRFSELIKHASAKE